MSGGQNLSTQNENICTENENNQTSDEEKICEDPNKQKETVLHFDSDDSKEPKDEYISVREPVITRQKRDLLFQVATATTTTATRYQGGNIFWF